MRLRILILLLCGVYQPGWAQTTLAVIDFEGRGIAAGETATLTDRFRDELVRTGRFIVVERRQMEEVLREQGFQQAGCTTDACVVEIGKLIGVQQMVGGSIGRVGTVFSVSARVIDVESGRIVNVTNYDHSGDIGSLLTAGMRQVVSGLLSEAPAAVPAQPQGSGSLYLTSEPAGASVWLDGIEVPGIAPLMLENQAAGEHTVLARKDDFAASQTVTVKRDDVTRLNLILERGTGKLKVLSEPFEAQVYVDGDLRGQTPVVVSDLRAGSHDVRLHFAGYQDHSQEVVVQSDAVTDLMVTLKPLATLQITSSPPGAIVLIQGAEKGKTPATVYLPEGSCEIVVRRDGYYDTTMTVTAAPEEKLTRDITLKPWQGNLSVTSLPTGATVYIAGKVFGQTPLRIDRLVVGEHTMELQLPDHFNASSQVQIRKDTTSTWHAELSNITILKQHIAGLGRRRNLFLAGSTGALAAALVIKLLADNNYREYQTATIRATELHKTIDRQDLAVIVLTAVGIVSVIPAIKYHLDQNRIRTRLERSR